MSKENTTIQVDSDTVSAYLAAGWGFTQVVMKDQLQHIEISIGDNVDNVINVALQLQDPASNPLANSISVLAFLADDAGGKLVTKTAPAVAVSMRADAEVVEGVTSHVGIGTNGGCIHLVQDRVFQLTFEVNGLLDLNIGGDMGSTWHLVVILPSGHMIVSDPIAF
jgi:uncharacterized protein (DUF4415 family)